jgi:hypothetical protein
MTDAIQKAREARFHIDRMNAWLRELWEAKSLTLHMSDGTTRSDMFGLLQNIRSDVMAIRDSALAALDAETEVKVRELDWSGQSWGYIGPLYESETMLGTYTVEEYGAGNWCTYFNRAKFGDTHATEEAAKDAVQANYERRIRSALVPPESRS